MNRLQILSFSVAVSLLSSNLVSAQTVATDPVGFLTPFVSTPGNPNLLAGSDTLVSITFTRPPDFVGAVSAVSTNTITVSGTPWTSNQFVYNSASQHNHYYALIGPGTSNPKEGRMYPITANSTNSLTIDNTQDNPVGVPAGSQVLVIAYWTLGTVFPSTDANVSYTPTTLTRSYQTEVLVPNYSASGTNQGFSTSYFYSNNVNNSTNNVGWRVVGDNTTPHDDDILLPDGYMVVRNQAGSPNLTLTTLGSVLTKKIAIPLATSKTGLQDNSVSMIRPVDVPLISTGLTPSDGSFVATTSTRSYGDELLVFNSATALMNRAPSITYFYSNNVNGSTNNIGWRVVGDNSTSHDNDLIPAGSALIIRKAKTADGSPVYWTNSPTY